MAVDRLHVIIEGMVQGVGFRYSTREEAHRRGLTGWVRNRPDGAVEAEFEGDRHDLEDMLAWCRGGPPPAEVRDVRPSWDSGEPRYQRFSVRG